MRIVAFLVVVAAAVVFAYWHVGRQRVDVDEDVYVVSGWEYLHGVFIRNLEHPPTAKYLFGLAEVLLGAPGPLGPRYVAATASLGTGLLFFLWFRRPVGYWAALIAAALWWLTPGRTASPGVTRAPVSPPGWTARRCSNRSWCSSRSPRCTPRGSG